MAFSGTERYVPVRLIGSGTMGEVYEVEDRAIGGQAALKVLSGVSGTAIAKFKRQFRNFCNIHHDNIVQLYEMGSEEGRWFFTMELVDGLDLLRYVCRGGDWYDTDPGAPAGAETTGPALLDHIVGASPCAGGYSDSRLRDSFRQLALGLTALHNEGLVHRDIKPENVLVTKAGRVVILDFSLGDTMVEAGVSFESQDALAGTAPYMAPEVAAEREVNAAADWYSVGVLLYRALTGQFPFDGPPLEVLLRKQSELPRSPEDIHPNCDRELSAMAMALLDPDPDKRASGRDLLEVLGKGGKRLAQSGIQSVSLTDLFVGRAEELDLLGRAYLGLGQSSHRVLLLEGPSGIGKTRLMEQFLRAVSQGELGTRGLVFRGRCYERETLPYKAFDAVIDRMSSYLAHLSVEELSFVLPEEIWYLVSVFPVLNRIRVINDSRYLRPDGGDPTVARHRAFTSLAVLLGRLSRQQPLVLGIDDLQWADEDSMELLDALMQGDTDDGMPPGRILVVATVRPKVMARWVQASIEKLEEAGLLERMEVAPLVREESERLVMHLLAGGRSRVQWKVEHQWVDSILDEAGGNPFLMGEMAQFLRQRSQDGVLDSNARVDLHEVVARRIQYLPELSRRIIAYVAVAGEPIEQRLLADAMGESRQTVEWRRALAQLSSVRLVRFQGFKSDDIVEIYHDRGRRAVLDLLGEEEIREIHSDLALAMERGRRADAQALANHWLAGGAPDRAKEYLVRAARASVAKLAFGRASRLLSTAVDLEKDDEARYRLLLELGQSLVNDGRLAEAIDRFDQASRASNVNVRLRALLEAVSNRLKAGYIEQGLASLRPILTELGLRMPRSGMGALLSVVARRARMKFKGMDFRRRDRSEVSEADLTKLEVLWSLASSMSLVDPLFASFFHSELWLKSFEVGLPEYVAVALVIEAGTKAAVSGEGVAEGKRLITLAESLVSEDRDPRLTGRILLAKGMIAHFAGEWSRCEQYTKEALELFRTRAYGTGWEVSAALSFLGWATMRQGRIQDMLRLVQREFERSMGRRERLFRANMQTSVALLWLAQDRAEEAERLIEAATATWPSDRVQIQHVYSLYGKTDLLLYDGRAAEAWDMLQREIPGIKRSVLWRLGTTRQEMLRGLARVALALAAESDSSVEKKTYLRAAANAIKGLRKERLPYVDAHAEHLDALGVWVAGRHEAKAKDKLSHAVGMLESAGLSLYALTARRSLARISGDGAAVEAIDETLCAEGVVRPDKIEAVLSPGVVSNRSVGL